MENNEKKKGIGRTIRHDVQYQVNRLLKEKNTGAGKEALANLRRGAARKMSESIDSLRYVYQNLSDEILDSPKAREAVFVAMTMFAFHQQGDSSAPRTAEGGSIGTALREYLNKTQQTSPEEEDRMAKKLGSLLKAKSVYEASRYLKSLIALIKSAKEPIAIDYARLASDLYKFQYANSRDEVILRWATDFYKKQQKNEEEK